MVINVNVWDGAQALFADRRLAGKPLSTADRFANDFSRTNFRSILLRLFDPQP